MTLGQWHSTLKTAERERKKREARKLLREIERMRPTLLPEEVQFLHKLGRTSYR